jgi:hypothetical protein
LPVQPVPCNGRNNMISHDISQRYRLMMHFLHFHTIPLRTCDSSEIWRFEDGLSIYSTGPTLCTWILCSLQFWSMESMPTCFANLTYVRDLRKMW